jgi:hypothetical protein
MKIWLMIDGKGDLHGPFWDLHQVMGYGTVREEPITLLQVENGAEGPVCMVAAKALTAAIERTLLAKDCFP